MGFIEKWDVTILYGGLLLKAVYKILSDISGLCVLELKRLSYFASLKTDFSKLIIDFLYQSLYDASNP